ncbi:hypothetical protein [Methanosphaerula palustris]|uniref:Uncharacterized protein n=1 Tax=Methanosphaerula palustris (strain ATCC BAA-1556 / DSM 19958 / E1-9c) TaxID=521011 RepID=B8GID9_METPE|nr:hypothetical protein [Methanosphaerula palustris]ACL15490.1 conserved hypothetical protein [Methanosphaerula palustris E1-9c]
MLIDQQGTGHIRITRRVNFRVILSLLGDLFTTLQDEGKDPVITLYLTQSLCADMSDNISAFIEFCNRCLAGTVSLVVIDQEP